jgi:hypothetical protein
MDAADKTTTPHGELERYSWSGEKERARAEPMSGLSKASSFSARHGKRRDRARTHSYPGPAAWKRRPRRPLRRLARRLCPCPSPHAFSTSFTLRTRPPRCVKLPSPASAAAILVDDITMGLFDRCHPIRFSLLSLTTSGIVSNACKHTATAPCLALESSTVAAQLLELFALVSFTHPLRAARFPHILFCTSTRGARGARA